MAKLITTEVIKHSAYITYREGYVKRSDNGDVVCTADRVIDSIETNSIDEDEFDEVKDRISMWLNYINDTTHQCGEYFDNVRSEILKPSIDEIKVGLIASSFASFDKYMIYKAKNNLDKKSEFLGNEGDAVTFNISEHRLVKSGQSKFGNGKYFLYRIKDSDGNIIIYFADHDCEFEFGHSNKACGTISKLNTFNEVKQTNVSKLKFL